MKIRRRRRSRPFHIWGFSFLVQIVLINALFLVRFAASQGQNTPPNYILDHWTVADGLPTNALTQVRQTADGYIWIGTEEGLARFDGSRFVTFDRTNTPGLPHDHIERIMMAADSSLWIQTVERQAVHFTKGTMIGYGAAEGLPKGATYILNAQGQLWLNGAGKLYRYSRGRVDSLREQPANMYGGVYEDGEGAYWFATLEHGLIRYRNGSYRAYTIEDGLASNRILRFLEDQLTPGLYWVLAGGRLHRFENDVLSVEPLELDLLEMFQEPSGRWWLTSASAVYRSSTSDPNEAARLDGTGLGPFWEPHADAAGHVWVQSREQIWRDGNEVFTHDDIRHFVVDRSGSAWITTSDGLYRLKPVPFKVFGPPEGFTDDVVFPVLEDREGRIWAGTQEGGLNQIIADTVQSVTVSGLPSLHVYALHEDQQGIIWAGTGAGVCRMEGVATCRRLPELDFEANTRAIWQDRRGALWFGTEQGLYLYRDGSLRRFTTDDGLSSDWVQGILETRDGSLWFATNGGGIVHYRDGEFTALTTAEGLANDAVRAVYEDDDGALWVGSEGGGLTRITFAPGTPEVEEVHVIGEEHGLFDTWLHLVLEDEEGRLWMSSNRGIFWVWKRDLEALARGERADVHSVVYSERDGLRSAAGNGRIQPSGLKASDGRLWFPTENGLAVIDPAALDRFTITPTPIIEQLDVWGELIPIHTGSVDLAAEQRMLTLEYTALNWPDGDRVQFQYRLDGHEDDWVEAGRSRRVVYGGLGPGTYSFRVRAMNQAGVWSSQEAALAVSVAPYYYERVWFWLLAGLIALGGIGSVLQWRLRKHIERSRQLEAVIVERTAEVERQAQELRVMDRAKSRFFANLSHEFRTPLTLSMGPLEDVKSDLHGAIPAAAKQQIDLALLNNRRLLRLVNQLLDIARLEAHSLTLQVCPMDLSSLLRRLALAFTPLAERKQIAFTCDLPNPDASFYADPDQLEKIFTNLLSNAFKFTPDQGRIRMEVELEPDEPPCSDGDGEGWLVVHVRDSGPGIPDDQQNQIFDRFYQTETGSNHAEAGTGIGLSLVRELVSLHRGCIDVESAVGWGTTFSVYLQTGAAHFEDRADISMDHTPFVPDIIMELEESADEPYEQREEAGSSDEAGEQDRLTVLIVDDNAEVRAFVRQHLRVHYRTVEAENGRVGLDKARALTPDLILSDVMMPEMDGYALCRAVKQDPEIDFIPVVLLTAKADSEDRLEGLEGGADDYLTKPFDMAELKMRIANLIDLRRRLRERFQQAGSPPPAVDVKSTDDVFREGVRAAVEAHLADEDFGVEALAQVVGMDRSHLYRRMKESMGQSPSAYILETRLERAAGLLMARAGTVSEIAYGVGFRSVPYFTTAFRKRYGCTPTQYRG